MARWQSPMGGKHWVLWDGDCDFCRRVARWVERKDRERRFEVVPYQEAPSPPMTPALRKVCEQALQVVTAEGALLSGGRACLFIVEGLGWPALAGFLARRPLIWIVEFGYRLVAANRRLLSRILFRSD